MNQIWFYSLLSVFVVSLVSFIGVLTLAVSTGSLRKILIYLVSFSAGALLGDTFIHLLPEAVKENGFGLEISLSVLFGIVFFFFIEKIICWRHCHLPITKSHVHRFAYMNLIGDGLHNFLDGAIIAASYLVSLPVGLATTLAVVLHEIPQEIGDFGVLLHGGFSKKKALLVNFLSALTAVLGCIITLWMLDSFANLEKILIPVAAGGFIYIAGSDLIPELHKERTFWGSLLQIIYILLGIGIMCLLV